MKNLDDQKEWVEAVQEENSQIPNSENKHEDERSMKD